MKKSIGRLIPLVLLLTGVWYAGTAGAIDLPHSPTDNVLTVNCNNCHYDPASPPPWTTITPSQDNTIMNNLCTSCHKPGEVTDKYADVQTHSSYKTSNKYGTWVMECRTCHQPHYQQQVRAYSSLGSMVTGTVTAVSKVSTTMSTFTVGGALSASTYTNYVFIPNTTFPGVMYRIMSNTSNTVTVMGNVNITYAQPNKPYAIKYGKMVKNQVATLSYGTKTALFFQPTGTNSFADGDATIDGICQVCHTKTGSFTNAGILEGAGHPTGKAGTNCVVCHKHSEGFKARCEECHGLPPITGATGTNGLAKNDGGTGSTTPGAHQKHAVTLGYDCDMCHTGGMPASAIYDKKIQIGFTLGAFQGGTYDGRALPLANGYSYSPGNAGTAITNNGNMQCSNIYCHSKGQSDLGGALGAGDYAAPQWNVPSTAQCGTCHNVTAGSNPPTTGSHPRHAGTYAFACVTCHYGFSETAATHANGNVNVTIEPQYGSQAFSNADGQPVQRGFSGSTCSNTYCHSNGTSVSTGTILPNTSATWGSGSLACNSCHGNINYPVNDYRIAAPVYSSGSPKSNAHQLHVRANGSSVADPSCAMCHYPVTTTSTAIASTALHVNKAYDVQGSGASSPYPIWAGAGTGVSGAVSIATYTFNSAASTCSSVSCHPDGVGTTTTRWSAVNGGSTGYRCRDCHTFDQFATTTYHHATATCEGCHADHNVFSPMLNANSPGRAYNLSTTGFGPAPIPGLPPATGNYSNTDFDNSLANGGTCIACHSNSITKSTLYQKNDGTTKTPVISKADYNTSAHNYVNNPTSAFTSTPSGTFVANCSKCHNASTETKTFQNSTNTFKTHASPLRRLLASLGMTSPSDPEEEDFCYRCHSRSNDNNPGGGPAKLASGRDYYNVAAMSVASEAMYSLGRYSLTDTLNFMSSVPTPPAPGGSGSSDTFTGGVWQARDMLPLAGGVPPSQTVAITDAGNPDYWRMTSFVSPPVVAPTTIPAGTWTLTVWGYESNAGANCYLRGTIYVWTASGVLGQIIAPPASLNDESIWVPPGCDDISCWDGYWYVIPHELNTYNSANTLSLGGSQVALNAGDRIVVEVEVDSRAPSATTYTATYGWGSLVIPASVFFNWLPASESAHRMANYNGIHKPSPSDETRAYLSAHKHVECDDCHNPHAASAGTHSQGTNTVSNAVNGVDGVQTPSWPSAWTTPTIDDARATATYEWQVCFKCHSSYNTNLSGWSTTWTDLAKEFNPNNPSYHAVIGASRLPAGQGTFVNGWTQTSIMTCSDCHSNDKTGAGDPKGPHASQYGGILKGDGRSGQLCFNCHSSSFAGSGFSGPDGELHSCHYNFCGGGPGSPMNCYTCHSKIPHGAPRPRLFVLNGDDPKYLDPSTGHENSWTQNTWNYTVSECSGYCH